MVQIHGIRRASADAKYRQMTGQPVKPLILKLCLPAVISNLVTTAYNLTDTFFIGQLGTGATRDDAIFHIVLHHCHTGLPRIGGTGHGTDIAFHGNGIAHA